MGLMIAWVSGLVLLFSLGFFFGYMLRDVMDI